MTLPREQEGITIRRSRRVAVPNFLARTRFCQPISELVAHSPLLWNSVHLGVDYFGRWMIQREPCL